MPAATLPASDAARSWWSGLNRYQWAVFLLAYIFSPKYGLLARRAR